jgi:hypothetical protein
MHAAVQLPCMIWGSPHCSVRHHAAVSGCSVAGGKGTCAGASTYMQLRARFACYLLSIFYMPHWSSSLRVCKVYSREELAVGGVITLGRSCAGGVQLMRCAVLLVDVSGFF